MAPNLMQATEYPDQEQDRQRNSKQPKQQIASHNTTPLLIATRWQLAKWEQVPTSSNLPAFAAKSGTKEFTRRYFIGRRVSKANFEFQSQTTLEK
jgi:hypothetical protein